MSTETKFPAVFPIPHRDCEALQDIGIAVLDEERVRYEAKTLRRLIKALVKVQPDDGCWDHGIERLKELLKDIKPGLRGCTMLAFYQDNGGIGHQLAIMAVYALCRDDREAFAEAHGTAIELAFDEEPFKEWCIAMLGRLDEARKEHEREMRQEQEDEDLAANPYDVDMGAVH